MLIRIMDVEEGKTKNWLEFSCFNSALDVNRLFHISFCGTDINHNMSLTDKYNKKLLNMLNNDYGYAPYDIQKANEILTNHSEYKLW